MTGDVALVTRYDQVIFDLDGVLYIGEQPVPGAPEAVRKLRGYPVDIVYATNNASRSPEAVADLLTSIGVPAVAEEVLTSGRAAAAVLAERYRCGSPVLIVGSQALAEEVRRVGLRPVGSAAERPVAVVQGYGPQVGWGNLAEAAVAIRSGSDWIATNTDRTLPSPRGPLPGNGALVGALSIALDRRPDVVVGKPAAPLFQQAAQAPGVQRPLVVGDRLDTDIEGACRAGLDSLLVLTGVSRPADLLDAQPCQRPSYVAADLEGLFQAGAAFGGTEENGWRARVEGRTLVLEGEGSAIDALRALCSARWAGATGDQAGDQAGDTPVITPAGTAAQQALRELDLV